MSRRIREEVVGCDRDFLGKNNFLVQFEYGQKKQMSASLLYYLCEKEEVGQEADDNTSHLPEQ